MTPGSDPRLLQGTNVTAVLATLAFDAWAIARAPNGVSTAEVLAVHPTLVTPPASALSIVGLVHAALLAFALYQVRPSQGARPYLREIGWRLAASAVLYVTWRVAFLHSYHRPALVPLTLVPIYGLVASLLAIYLRLRVGLAAVPRGEKLAVHAPFSLALGWATPVCMVNTALVVRADVPGIPMSTQWGLTFVVLLALLGIGLGILRNRRDLAFALVVVWTTGSLAVARSGEPVIATAAAAVALLVAAAIPLVPVRRRQSFAACYLR